VTSAYQCRHRIQCALSGLRAKDTAAIDQLLSRLQYATEIAYPVAQQIIPAIQVELSLHFLPPCSTHSVGQAAVAHDTTHGVGQGVNISLWDQKAVDLVLDDFRNSAMIGRYDREAHRHGLGNWNWDSLYITCLGCHGRQQGGI